MGPTPAGSLGRLLVPSYPPMCVVLGDLKETAAGQTTLTLTPVALTAALPPSAAVGDVTVDNALQTRPVRRASLRFPA
jgi:hypothetical protein